MSKLIFSNQTFIRYGTFNEIEIEIPKEWQANFVWTGRDDYLEWVADWKTTLKHNIKLIRQAKIDRRTGEDSDRSIAQQQRQALRIDCSNLFLLRTMGKLEAAKQRESQRIAA